MEDRDSGQRTTALVTTLRRGSADGSCSTPMSGSGGPDRADPHTDIPLRRAHTPVEVAGPPDCGGGTTANVEEETCAMGWFQRCGSGTKRGSTRVHMRTAGGMGAREAKEGAMQGRCKRDAPAPHRPCGEDPVGLTLAATRIRSCLEVEREK